MMIGSISTPSCSRTEPTQRSSQRAVFQLGMTAAMELIARLELASREVYCGAVGWVDADHRRGELNVAIRTFWLSDGGLHFGTGAGITYDSTPEGEWDETELKARTLIGLASAAESGDRST